MSYHVTITSGLFRNEADRPRSNQVVRILLDALCAIDVAYRIAYPDTPLLYDAGVRYHTERPGNEEWTDTPTTYKKKWGDCEDLACIRASELRVRFGIAASPFFSWRKVRMQIRGVWREVTMYHIQVLYPPGVRPFFPDPQSQNPQIEDPSRLLGMGSGNDRL